MYTYYISVGSNMGDRRQYIATAFQSLQQYDGIDSVVSSSLLETEPWGFTEQEPFINAVWCVTSSLAPHCMLALLQSLEQAAQRQRVIHWGPRTLDLDIIYGFNADGECINEQDDRLQLPHPYFWKRLFVLVPLQELVPDFSYAGEMIASRIANLQQPR